MQNEAVPARPGKKKHLLWNIVFIGIAVLTVWVVASNAKGFSLENFRAYLSGNDPWWLSAAFGSMLAYVLLNALMIRLLLRDFGYHRNLWDCTTYTAADLYFSAITPSSTGGQPMEAWYMMQDGVPGVICTVVLLTYLLLYTVSIVLIGLVCLILYPNSFLAFGSFGRILIIIGAAIQLGLSLLYAVLLWNEQLLFRICDWFLRLLKKLHLLRHPDQKREKLRRSMERYSQATHLLAGRRRLLVKALLLNLFHRAAQIMVTVFCFLAGGGSLAMAPKMKPTATCQPVLCSFSTPMWMRTSDKIVQVQATISATSTSCMMAKASMGGSCLSRANRCKCYYCAFCASMHVLHAG